MHYGHPQRPQFHSKLSQQRGVRGLSRRADFSTFLDKNSVTSTSASREIASDNGGTHTSRTLTQLEFTDALIGSNSRPQSSLGHRNALPTKISPYFLGLYANVGESSSIPSSLQRNTNAVKRCWEHSVINRVPCAIALSSVGTCTNRTCFLSTHLL